MFLQIANLFELNMVLKDNDNNNNINNNQKLVD